ERTVLVTVLLQASYRGSKERQLLRTFEKTTLPGGFFRFKAKIRFKMVSGQGVRRPPNPETS
ncbi:hypothetical protein KFY67_26575, partial [Salmonella enterica subsp. enterica serovar 1,4,[5],12:i:-]|nr:hypothetical protein [Salmonella enterica subsp. enterica serovar 1,4,[5],12:i:-]